MQGAKAGFKGAIKAGAKAVSKEALQQMGKAAFKSLGKEALQKSLKELAEKLKCFVVRACFTGDSKINTPTGFKSIKDIRIGDEVYSFNEQKQELTIRKVTSLFEDEVEEILEIETENEIISTTRNHPFFVNGEFKDAEQIEPGEYLNSHDGRIIKVLSLNYIPKKEKVYNFEVEDDHCYFVGEDGILVLNACNNHREIFFRAFPRFRKYGPKVEIHHRIPQVWFKKGIWRGNKNALSNLIPLSRDFHRKVVSPAWARFKKQYPNPTQKQIYEKAKEIDKLIEEHLRKRGF